MTAASPIARLYRDHDRSTATLAAIPERWHQVAVDADVTDEHVAGFVVWLGAGLPTAVVAGSVFGVWFAVSALMFVLALPVLVVTRWRGRRLRRLVDSLPLVVEMIARSLRSGASFRQALAEAKADAPPVAAYELGRLLVEMTLGRTASQALRSWAGRHSHVEVRIVAAALALASENESGTSQALAGVGQSLRDRATLAAEIRAHAAQAVASMYALVLLPVGFLVVDALGGQGTLNFLVGERVGRFCLTGALVLEFAGWAWMRLLIRSRLLP